MAAGESPRNADESRVSPVLADVVADPGHRQLGIDYVVRPGCLRAESVIDRDADPAPARQLEHHGKTLLTLVADYPRPPVDVDHDRARLGRIVSLDDHIQPVALLSVTRVIDVPEHPEGPTGSRYREDPARSCPHRLRQPWVDLRIQPTGVMVGQRLLDYRHGGPARALEPDQSDPRPERHCEPEPARPRPERPEKPETDRRQRLPDDVLDRELTGQPATEKAEYRYRPRTPRPISIDHECRTDHTDREVCPSPCHGIILSQKSEVCEETRSGIICRLRRRRRSSPRSKTRKEGDPPWNV